jgi:hypothetical protein
MTTSTHKLLTPLTELRDADGLLHSDKGAALVLVGAPAFPLSECKFYYIHGRAFDPHRWRDIVHKVISLRVVLTLHILDRRAIVKYVGLEKLFYNSKPKLLSKTKKGNELFEIRTHPTREHRLPSYWLRYKCPSTGKIYISGVDPNFTAFSLDQIALPTLNLRSAREACPWLADCAMAWKLGLSLTQYYDIKEEA